jgi:hypothetical protein
MGVSVIPYNQQADPWAYASQGLGNLVGGLQDVWMRKQAGQDIQKLYQSLGQPMPFSSNPMVQQAQLGMAPQFADPFGIKQSQAGYYQQRGNALQNPVPKTQIIEWMDKDSALQKTLVTEDNYNNAVKAIEDAGGSLDTSKTNLQTVNTGEFLSVFNPRTAEIKQTQYPSSRVPSTTVNVTPASASERTAIAETNASMDILDNLKVLFDNPNTRTGPLVGRVDPTLGLIGKTPVEQEDFMAATSAFKNKIIKEITGAQMSEVEANRIMKQVPDITDPPARWMAKWKQSRKNLEMLQARRKEVLKQSGIKVPEESLPTVSTDADYDKLKSGDEFIDAETGKKYRKP